MIIDAHCHLQDERLYEKLSEVIKRAEDAAVSVMVCCGSEEADWADVLKIADSYPQKVVPAVGLHPWYIKQRSEKWWERLEEVLVSRKDVAIGECGLDFAIESVEDQESVFIKHLELARKHRRPVFAHIRKAFGKLLQILAQYGPLETGLVIHSYSGPPDLVSTLAKYNVYFSFSGSLTRSRNRRGRASAALVPPDRLLVETDAPDIPPVIRGPGPEDFSVPEVNEPAFIVHTLRTLAEIRGWTMRDASMITAENAKRLLSFMNM